MDSPFLEVFISRLPRDARATHKSVGSIKGYRMKFSDLFRKEVILYELMVSSSLKNLCISDKNASLTLTISL